MAPPTAATPVTIASATSFEQWCEAQRRVPDEWAWEVYRYEVLHGSVGTAVGTAAR